MNAQFQKITEYLKKHVSADDYQVKISAKDSHETRFAQNSVTQHIAGKNISVNLEVAFGNKTGRCSMNQTDEEALDYLIKTAEEMAKLNQPDPEYVESPSKQEYPMLQNTSEATLNLEPAKMVEIIRQSIVNAEKHSALVSGMTEKHDVTVFTSTKNGFEGEYRLSEFSHSMTLKKDHIETKVAFQSKDYLTFNLKEQLEKLNGQFSSLTDPQVFEADKLPVILRPEALLEFFWFMTWMMNRRQSDEGLTAFTGQLGQKYFGESFNLFSTLGDADLITLPFSWDGIVSDETYWVRNGILETMPTPRYWAKLNNLKPSSLFNLVIPEGNVSEAEMMKLVPRGLIVNRLWYIRPVDMKAGELTGITRDGVLYFEDGKVKHAVNNLRFNEIPHDVTRRIMATGKSELIESSVKMPAILVDNFNFVDKTSF